MSWFRKSEVNRYKKTEYVDAIQFRTTNMDKVNKFLQYLEGYKIFKFELGYALQYFDKFTIISDGEFIVKTPDGSIRTMGPLYFFDEYELVDES